MHSNYPLCYKLQPFPNQLVMMVKVLRGEEGRNWQLVFCDTYHLIFQPGAKIIRDAGGLHKFIGRQPQTNDKEDTTNCNACGPFITDSGEFQVFSIAITRFQRHTQTKKTVVTMVVVVMANSNETPKKIIHHRPQLQSIRLRTRSNLLFLP